MKIKATSDALIYGMLSYMLNLYHYFLLIKTIKAKRDALIYGQNNYMYGFIQLFVLCYENQRNTNFSNLW